LWAQPDRTPLHTAVPAGPAIPGAASAAPREAALAALKISASRLRKGARARPRQGAASTHLPALPAPSGAAGVVVRGDSSG